MFLFEQFISFAISCEESIGIVCYDLEIEVRSLLRTEGGLLFFVSLLAIMKL